MKTQGHISSSNTSNSTLTSPSLFPLSDEPPRQFLTSDGETIVCVHPSSHVELKDTKVSYTQELKDTSSEMLPQLDWTHVHKQTYCPPAVLLLIMQTRQHQPVGKVRGEEEGGVPRYFRDGAEVSAKRDLHKREHLINHF